MATYGYLWPLIGTLPQLRQGQTAHEGDEVYIT